MKKLMQKMIATVCAFFILSTCFSGIVMANDIVFDLNSLGITDGFGFENRLDSNVTRGEFAQVVVNLMGQEEVAASLASDARFNDVAYTPYAGAINLLNASGIVSGNGNGTYEPNRNVRYTEACKILVSILGYDAIVSGNLDSFTFVAGTIGVTDGVDTSNEFIKVRDMLVMVNNCLDIDKMVPMYYNSNISPSYEIDEGNTFRRNLLVTGTEGVEKLKGVVTADSSAYLISQRNNLKDTQIEIEGIVFDYGENVPGGLVGMEVEFYVTVEDGEYGEIIALSTTTKNVVTDISGDDIISFGDEKIEYYISDEKKEYLQLNNETQYIYNNNIDSSFNPTLLNYSNTITVHAVDNDEDEVADVVFVFEYTDRIVESVYTEREAVVLNKSYNGGINLVLDEEDTKARVEYFDAKGNETEYGAIASGDVISIASSKDGYSVRIVISKETVKGFVEAKDGEYVTINGIEYACSDDATGVKTGTNVEAWVSFAGKLIDYDEIGESEDYAYVYTVQGANGLGKTKVKLLIPSGTATQTATGDYDEETDNASSTRTLYVYNSEVLVYYLASKVRVNGTNYNDSKAAELIGNNAVSYALNENGEIYKVEFLEPLTEYETDSLTGDYLYDVNGNRTVKSQAVMKRMIYNTTEKVFGTGACLPFGIDSKTVAVCVPVEDAKSDTTMVALSDDELLNFKMEVANGIGQTVSAYEVDEDTHIAKFIVVAQTASSMAVGNAGNIQVNKKNVGLVTKASQVYDKETDNIYTKITMLTMGNQSNVVSQTFYVSDLIPENTTFKKLSEGDLIQYSLDHFDRLDNVRLIKDFDKKDTDLIENAGNVRQTYTFSVKNIDFDEIDSTRRRWVDILDLYSMSDANTTVETFKVPQNASLSPVVFIVHENGDAPAGSMKDSCINDRGCVYKPSSSTDVHAVVIYR